MKKKLIKFLAAGMTALTLMGTTGFMSPVVNVFAAETDYAAGTDNVAETSCEIYQDVCKTDCAAIIKELVGNSTVISKYDNCTVYQVGDKTYSFSVLDHGTKKILRYFGDNGRCFYSRSDAEKFISENSVIDASIYVEEYDSKYMYDEYWVEGYLPMKNLVVKVYEPVQEEKVELSAEQTTIRPGESTYVYTKLSGETNPYSLKWELWGNSDAATLQVYGDEACVTGVEAGTVMVRVEAPNGAYDIVYIDVVDFNI